MKVPNLQKAGRFLLAPGQELFGELSLGGSKTLLHLHSPAEFATHFGPNQYITGVLNDLVKVSLIDCVTAPLPARGSRNGEQYYIADSFPHFVVFGDGHIAPDQNVVAKIHFAVDDATALFYDFDAFGFLVDAGPIIETVTSAVALTRGREIAVGPNPQVLYFSGKSEIFSVDTVLGKVSASHNPKLTSWGGPSGVGLVNTILLTVEFKESVVFPESMAAVSTLLRYLEIVAGRPQNLVSLSLSVDGETTPTTLHVYWAMCPGREPRDEWEKPHPADVLLDAVRKRDEFCQVLQNWLNREQLWRNARLRFSSCFAKQNHYDIDRLVGAANMFDILEPPAVPPATLLSDELEAAKKISRDAFKATPHSPERHDVLIALKRMGTPNLKRKIRHRVSKVEGATGTLFPDLSTVTDEAVNCRNFYVHGAEASFDYGQNSDLPRFFTDALEFVFAASDLIEAGWDVNGWASKGTSMTHGFGRFLVDYKRQLMCLKALLLGTE